MAYSRSAGAPARPGSRNNKWCRSGAFPLAGNRGKFLFRNISKRLKYNCDVFSHLRLLQVRGKNRTVDR